MQTIRVAVLGDEQLCTELKSATAGGNYEVVCPPDGSMLDEWRLRRWFSETLPMWTFIGVGTKGQTGVNSFLSTVKGSISALECSLGFSEHVRLISHWATPEFFLLRRLCELYRFERGADYQDIVATKGLHLAQGCVLQMQHVSTQKENAGGAESKAPGGEMRDPLVSEQTGDPDQPGARGDLQGVLEVPHAKA